MKTKVIIYARVSTSGQDYERQLSELRKYASRMDYVVVKEFSERASGAKKVAEREALTDLLKFVNENQVDKVLIYECSRLSRRITDFLNVIEFLTERGISLFILQNGLETLQADGSVNPIAQLVMGIISQFNSMERNLIRSRMESGYKHFRQQGGKVGRKVGYRKSTDEMKTQYSKEIQLIKKGISLRNITAICGTSVNTLQKIKKII
ncbi:recombinase family protein [uncultured Alistipes sp.]|uniref:recombinase family protein n=1 Tax=uncultured Alistipes sp. TaxID=538949 RepID=UPI00261B044B|nr:recombinase family protein [uncultured Alistipes sp.]